MKTKTTLRQNLNVTKLKSLQVQQDLKSALTVRFAGATLVGVETKWETFEDVCAVYIEQWGTVNSKHDKQDPNFSH